MSKKTSEIRGTRAALTGTGMVTGACTTAAAVAILGLASGAVAQEVADELFEVVVTVGDTQGSTTLDGIEDFFEAFESGETGGADLGITSLSDINENYTATSDAVVDANLRGLPIQLEYAGTTVTFRVPDLDIELVFDDAGSRTGNEDDLETFLEDDTDGVLSSILGGLVAETPNDPVAGNPNSLQAQLVTSDFSIGTAVGTGNSFATTGGGAGGGETSGEGGDEPNLIGFGARLGRFSADGVDTTVITLPINYTIPLSDPRYAIILDFPLTYVQTEDFDSYAASFGVGVRVPVFDNWYLTPAARIGATGSIDLGSAGVLYSASLSSNFTVGVAGLDVTLGNLVSYVATAPVDLPTGDYDIEYDLQNFVTRNGIEVGGGTSFELFGNPVTWEASAVNTQIFGDDVFIDNYTDLALSIGTQASQNRLTWDALRFGVTYTFASGEDYDGFRVNFGYQF